MLTFAVISHYVTTRIIIYIAVEKEAAAAAANNNNNISSMSDVDSPQKPQSEVSAHVTMAIRPASESTITNGNR